ncbi:IS3 family transposase, partial [Mesorhizobium sp. M0768]
SPHEREHNARPRDAMDKETCVPRSRGRSLVVLYNTARPHSQIAWQTPAEFATTFNLRRSLALRDAKGSAPAPVASPAQQGTTHAGNELKTG